MSWLDKLKSGLGKSSEKISGGISDIFNKRKLDKSTLDELEELLISADLGAATAAEIIEKFAEEKFDKEAKPEEIKEFLASIIAEILEPAAKQIEIDEEAKPHVIMVVGVNGNGKTTSIGKMAHFFKAAGYKVQIAAADTFRAAAVAQLAEWAKRAGVECFTGKDNQDPASVAFQALEKAKTDSADILIIDTAGRLQNKQNLMAELSKISNVCKKVLPNAPHNTILVLDATTGQNAISQVEEFKNSANLTGLIVTKLDGTAKGGIVVALAQKFGLPIHAIGVGEGIEDMKPFDAQEFANQLVGLN